MAAFPIMAWPYLRAAILQRLRLPLLGEVPVNLAAMGAFGIMGLDNPVFWAVGGGVEALWLGLTAGRRGYREKVDAARRREAWRRVEERRLVLYNQLPPAARHRHYALRAACQALLNTAPGSDPEATAELFTWLHLKLLLAREALAAGQTPAPDADLPRLQAQAILDVPDPATARLADHSISLLETRRQHTEDTAQRLAQIDQHLTQIEGEIDTARQRRTRDHTPHDFRHSLALARERLRDDLEALPPSRPVAEVDSLLSGLGSSGDSPPAIPTNESTRA